jgi:hypothetical protein
VCWRVVRVVFVLGVVVTGLMMPRIARQAAIDDTFAWASYAVVAVVGLLVVWYRRTGPH